MRTSEVTAKQIAHNELHGSPGEQIPGQLVSMIDNVDDLLAPGRDRRWNASLPATSPAPGRNPVTSSGPATSPSSTPTLPDRADPGEWIADGGHHRQWDHAVIAVDVPDDGTIRIVEAEPGGARLTGWHYQSHPHLRSRGRVQTTPAAAPAGLRYVGVPYSFLDCLAIAAHALHSAAGAAS